MEMPTKEQLAAPLQAAKTITVADIDPLMAHYHVLISNETEIGAKTGPNCYIKPEYDIRGRLNFGKRYSWETRKYKKTPPWFRYIVVKIGVTSFGLSVFVKKETQDEM